MSNSCDPMDCRPPGSSVHGIFQAKIVEWIAISFSRGSSRPEPRSPALQADSLPTELWGKPNGGKSEWPSSKHLQPINAGEHVEKMEPSYTVTGNSNWNSHYQEQDVDFLKILGRFLENTRNKATIWPCNLTNVHTPWENHNSKSHIYPSVHCSTIYNIQDLEVTWMSLNRWMDKEAVIYIYTMEY